MRQKIKISLIITFFAFLILSFIFNIQSGLKIGENFINFIKKMVILIPCAFILIGLFEVWIKRETIEKHLGEESGLIGFFWAILLASTTVGGLYVAFPIAFTLHQKGAGVSVIFTYLGAAAICRIPMTLFEASFVGIKFTLIRWAISIPLVIITSIIIDKLFIRDNFTFKD